MAKLHDWPMIEDVTSAQQRISPFITETPLLCSPLFEAKYGITTYVKADSCTPTGSFKLRGALNAICCLDEKQRKRGVVAFSTGNHAQAVAYTAKLLNIPAIIIMPSTAPAVKIANTKSFGAEVVLFDQATECRESLARHYVEAQQKILIPPYDDFNVIAGQGVSALECCTQLQALDVVPDQFYLPIAGGGYLAGFSIAKKQYFPDSDLIGVEDTLACPWSTSLKSKSRILVASNPASICDAIMPPKPKPGELPWKMLKEQLSSVETITNGDALTGMACAMKYFGLVAEPSGACTLGYIAKNGKALRGKTVVVSVSGRNLDQQVLQQAVDHLATV